MSRRAAAAVFALIALASCGGGGGAGKATPAGPASSTVDAGAGGPLDRAALIEIADGLQEVLATMAAIAERAPDCATMGRQLEELFDRSDALFEIAKAQGEDPVAGPMLADELDARAAAVGPVTERIATGLTRCRDDAGVIHAIERMPTL